MLDRAPRNENELIGHALFRAAEEKSEEVDDKHRLQMEPFMSLYTKDQVLNDYRKVAKLQAKFSKAETTAARLGFIFESSFLDLANQHGWFGRHSEIVRASKFDDVINHIDMIATLAPQNKAPQSLEIGADLTFSQKKVGDKFERAINEVKSGRLSMIKYFHSDLIGHTGKKMNVPRSVVGLDNTNLPNLLRQWVHEPDGDFEAYRSLMLHQIQQQMYAFRNLARDCHGEDSTVFRAYNGAAELLTNEDLNLIPREELPRDSISNQIFARCTAL